MSTSITSASMKVLLNSIFKNTRALATPTSTVQLSLSNDFVNGTGASHANVVWEDLRSLNTGTSETLDLAGALVGDFSTVTFTKIKAIAIWLVTASTGYRIEIGGAASNAFADWVGNANDVVKLQAGGTLALSAPVDGYTVTADTGDLLKINNPSGGTVQYGIWILGEGTVG